MGLPGRVTNDPTNYFALGVQGAKDQEAGTFYFFKHLDGSGFDVAHEVSSEREGGSGREFGLRYKTMVKADGQLVAYARPDAAGRLLTYALGSDTPSIIATSGATSAIVALVNHQIQSGVNATLPYLTADQGWADEIERTTNCLINNLSIEGQAGHPVKMTVAFNSGGTVYQRLTSLTPAREQTGPCMYPGASAWVGVFGGQDAGATSIEITKFKIDAKNQLDDAIQTTGLNREDLLWLNSDYQVDGTLKYTDRMIWNEINYAGGTQVPVTLATGSFNLYAPAAGSPSNALALGMPLMDFSAVKVNRLDPDGKTMYLDFTAMTRKGATNSLFANVISAATQAYTATST